MGGWFRVEADVHRHPKVIALPSPAARWAFIVTLAEGKAVDGRWVNERHYRACVPASEARHLDALIKVGLIVKQDDAVVIHDWDDYQWAAEAKGPKDPTAAERKRRERERKRLEEEAAARAGVTAETVTDTVTSRVTSRALSVSRSVSRSETTPEEPYPVSDATGPTRHGLPHLTDDIRHAIEAAVGRSFSTLHGWPATELDRLVEERPGALAAIPDAMARAGTYPSWAQFVQALRDVLEPMPSSRPGRTAAAPKGMVQPVDEIREAIRAQ